MGVVAPRRFGGRDGLANAQEVTPTSVSRPVRGCRIEVPAAVRGPSDGPFRLVRDVVSALSRPDLDSDLCAIPRPLVHPPQPVADKPHVLRSRYSLVSVLGT